MKRKMENKMLEKVKQFVNESFEQSVTRDPPKHFENTLYWAQQLKPTADEAILIAAYAHDIQRAFRKTSSEDTFKTIEINDPEFLKKHQEEGAKIISNFLKKENYDNDKINRISNMVRHHEEGGDEESNLIKDADSVSYFEVNSEEHVNKLVGYLGLDKVKRKIDWMFNRISSQKAKDIAKPMYERAIKLLETEQNGK